MQLPAHVPARELVPGDVVVLEAGDTRQLYRLEVLVHGLVNCDWGDGRHSLLDSDRVVVLLHRPGSQGRPASAKIEGETLGGDSDATTPA